jgi:hypothetical protein
MAPLDDGIGEALCGPSADAYSARRACIDTKVSIDTFGGSHSNGNTAQLSS